MNHYINLERFTDMVFNELYWRLFTAATIYRKPETVGSTTKPTMQRLQRLIDYKRQFATPHSRRMRDRRMSYVHVILELREKLLLVI